MANTSRSPKPLKKGKNQPNTKVRKLRKRIKKSKHNFQKKTTSTNPNKRIPTNSNRRRKVKKHNNLAASIFAMTILLLSAGVAITISWISALFIFNPLSIEAIWYLFLKYKGFRKADLRSPATIRVQENEKS